MLRRLSSAVGGVATYLTGSETGSVQGGAAEKERLAEVAEGDEQQATAPAGEVGAAEAPEEAQPAEAEPMVPPSHGKTLIPPAPESTMSGMTSGYQPSTLGALDTPGAESALRQQEEAAAAQAAAEEAQAQEVGGGRRRRQRRISEMLGVNHQQKVGALRRVTEGEMLLKQDTSGSVFKRAFAQRFFCFEARKLAYGLNGKVKRVDVEGVLVSDFEPPRGSSMAPRPRSLLIFKIGADKDIRVVMPNENAAKMWALGTILCLGGVSLRDLERGDAISPTIRLTEGNSIATEGMRAAAAAAKEATKRAVDSTIPQPAAQRQAARPPPRADRVGEPPAEVPRSKPPTPGPTPFGGHAPPTPPDAVTRTPPKVPKLDLSAARAGGGAALEAPRTGGGSQTPSGADLKAKAAAAREAARANVEASAARVPAGVVELHSARPTGRVVLRARGGGAADVLLEVHPGGDPSSPTEMRPAMELGRHCLAEALAKACRAREAEAGSGGDGVVDLSEPVRPAGAASVDADASLALERRQRELSESETRALRARLNAAEGERERLAAQLRRHEEHSLRLDETLLCQQAANMRAAVASGRAGVDGAPEGLEAAFRSDTPPGVVDTESPRAESDGADTAPVCDAVAVSDEVRARLQATMGLCIEIASRCKAEEAAMEDEHAQWQIEHAAHEERLAAAHADVGRVADALYAGAVAIQEEEERVRQTESVRAKKSDLLYKLKELELFDDADIIELLSKKAVQAGRLQDEVQMAREQLKRMKQEALRLEGELKEKQRGAADEAHAMNGRQNKHTKSLLKHLQVAEP